MFMWDLYCNIVTLCLLLAIFANRGITVDGERTYVVAFLGLKDRLHEGQDNWVTYDVAMTNPNTHDIVVNITGKDDSLHNLTIRSYSSESAKFNDSHGLYRSQFKGDHSWVFGSKDNFTLQVFVHNLHTGYSEGFLGIPIEELLGMHDYHGYYEYIVATFCGFGGYCQFAVASLEDHTKVSVTLPPTVDDIVFCYHGQYFHTKYRSHLTLRRYSALQIETTMDLSGTRIYSEKPIVVFAGARNLTYNNVTGHVIEQLFTTSNWGTRHYVRNVGGTVSGDVINLAANWANTRVEVAGYADFIIANFSHVVTRKLPHNRTILVHSSKPIQIVQMTGLVGKSPSDRFSPGMVVVSRRQHGRSRVVGYCSGNTTFLILATNNTNLTKTPDFVEYTEHSNLTMIGFSSSGPYSFTTNADDIFGGLVRCGESAVMPIHCQAYSSSSNESTSNTDADEGSVVFDKDDMEAYTTPASRAHVVDIRGYSRIRVRVQACGSVIFTFTQDAASSFNASTNNTTESTSTESVMFDASQNRFTYTHCTDVCTQNMSIHHDILRNEYNEDVNCTHGMAAYWFSLNDNRTTLCGGPGPFIGRSKTCLYLNSTTPTHLLMIGLSAEAYFHYDLQIRENGRYIPGWRCVDFLSNCTEYGIDYCNISLYRDFTETLCPKYCGTCHPDSYGRDFQFALPAYKKAAAIRKVEIYITSVVPNAKIFVGGPKRALTETRLVDNYTRYTYTPRAKSSNTSELIVVTSNHDVTVTVYISTRNTRPMPITLYPVDTFDLEYVPYMNGCDTCHCNLVALSGTSAVIVYVNDTSHNGTEHQYIKVKPERPYKLDRLARRIIANEPIGLFCGSEISPVMNKQSYYQVLPADTLGTNYILPKVGFLTLRVRTRVCVKLGDDDDAFVSISNDKSSDSFMLDKTISNLTKTLTGGGYIVTSDRPVSVGMLYEDDNGDYGQFIPLLPVSGFTRNTNMAFPVRYLSDEYNVSDITIHSLGNLSNGNITNIRKYLYNDTMHSFQYGGHPHNSVALLTGSGSWFIVPIPGQTMGKTQQVDMPCVTSFPVTGDNRDNDCDGKVDEDTCVVGYGMYSRDDDADGAYNEDCSQSMNSTPIASPHEVPATCNRNHVHSVPNVPNKNLTACWTPCTCPCSWENNLKAFNNMTREEKQQYARESDEKYRTLLQVQKEHLSKTRNTKTGAPDHRVTSRGIGMGSIGLIVCFVAILLLLDMRSIVNACFVLAGNLREMCRHSQARKLSKRRIRRRSVAPILQHYLEN